MVLETGPAWKREMARAKPEIRYRVEIDFDSSTTLRAVTGTEILPRRSDHEDDYPPSVLRVSSKSAGFDPWSRAGEMSDRSIVFRADGLWRDMIYTFLIYRRVVRIYKGTPRVPAAEWLLDWVGVVDDYDIADDGTLTLSCLDLLLLIEDRKIRGFWYQAHPLEILTDVISPISFEVGEEGGGIPRRYFNSESFNERRYPRTSHWSITRAGTDYLPPFNGQIDEPIEARDAANQLLWLLGGSIRYDASGRLEYVDFNRRRPPARHLGRDQIRWCRTRESGGPVNRIDFGGWPGTRKITLKQRGWRPSEYMQKIPVNIEEVDRFYRAEDEGAQRRLAVPGEEKRIVAVREDSEWIRAQGFVTITGSVASISGATEAGFCGSRWRDINANQDPDDGIGPARDRFTYILTDYGEIIELDSFGSAGTPTTVNSTGARFRYQSSFGIARRNINGAVNADGDPIAGDYTAEVRDVTIFFHRAQDMVPRWIYGAPTIELGMAVENADLQPGDFLSIDHDSYGRIGVMRATHRSVFEIVNVADNTSEDDPEIVVVATWAYEKSVLEGLPPGVEDAEPDTDPIRVPRIAPPAINTARTYTPPRQYIPPIPFGELLRGASQSERGSRWQIPVGDLVPSEVSGTTIAISSGRAQGSHLSSPQWGGSELSLTDDMQSHIRMDTRSGGLVIEEQAVGSDDDPVRDPWLVPVARVTVESGAITELVDLRQLVPAKSALDIIDEEFPRRAGSKFRAGRTQTSGITTATALEVDIPEGTAGTLHVQVSGFRAFNGWTGMWQMTVRVRNDGSGVRLYDEVTQVLSRDDSSWLAYLDVDGDNVRVRVGGAAFSDIDWTASATLSAADGL